MKPVQSICLPNPTHHKHTWSTNITHLNHSHTGTYSSHQSHDTNYPKSHLLRGCGASTTKTSRIVLGFQIYQYANEFDKLDILVVAHLHLLAAREDGNPGPTFQESRLYTSRRQNLRHLLAIPQPCGSSMYVRRLSCSNSRAGHR